MEKSKTICRRNFLKSGVFTFASLLFGCISKEIKPEEITYLRINGKIKFSFSKYDIFCLKNKVGENIVGLIIEEDRKNLVPQIM